MSYGYVVKNEKSPARLLKLGILYIVALPIQNKSGKIETEKEPNNSSVLYAL